MVRIDDPRGVAIQQLREDCETNPLKILMALASVHPKAHVVNSILEHFSVDKRIERVADVFEIFNQGMNSLERNFAADHLTLSEMRKRLDSPEFADAVVAAAEEAVRTASAAKIHRLASVLANGCDPNIEPSDDDLTSFIHDVAQLSEADVRVLQQLSSAFTVFSGLGDRREPGSESPLKALDGAVREQALTDDFHSHCFRLVGFGLAAQIPSNSPSLACIIHDS